MPERVVHHADAMEWLSQYETVSGASMITSLPDFSEFPKLTLDEWKKWFIEAASLVMSKCDHEGISIFYQSDVKKDGVWIDKSFLCQVAAQNIDQYLIAHKIICRAPAGVTTNDKPGYSHLLCFSRTARPDVAKSFTDVLPEAGETTWTRGMGLEACKLACQIILDHTPTRTIVDPFCGHGTVLAVANDLGLNAIGVDHKLKYSKIASELTTNW
jgi:hypothetical protein